MEKNRTSLLSSLFPWLSPHVIKFALVNGGIEVQLWKNNQQDKKWNPSQLHNILPEPLIKWSIDNHLHEGPQPYPLVKHLWQNLLPFASKKLIIDSSVFAELEEVSQPGNVALNWVLNSATEQIEGQFEGADRYLGMGWFQKGAKVWALNNQIPAPIDLQLKNLTFPLQQTDSLLNQVIPNLQQYVTNGVYFQLINNFIVTVVASDIGSGKVTFRLESNYPGLLPTLKIPRQPINMLLSNRTIIRFPSQALTPLLMRLFQMAGSSLMLQGTDIPLFIREQLPVISRFRQINEEAAAQIIKFNPIVSIGTLKPTLALTHRYENGIGLYSMAFSYQHQQHTLDMPALLAAFRQNQRYTLQHAIWFEWPLNAQALANTIQQNLTLSTLRAAEIMGFDTQRIVILPEQQSARIIQPSGKNPFERAESVFEQLRYHGIPGGIVGEPKGLIRMFVNVCEKLLRENRQARILWLVPTLKKGAVTTAVQNSQVSSFVTVASFTTLRNESALFLRSWTLVIFHNLNTLLLDGDPLSARLPQLKWQWALTALTPDKRIAPLIMQTLHLPAQYFDQFQTSYLFDLDINYQSQPPTVQKSVKGPSPIVLSQTPRSVLTNQETKAKPDQLPVPPTAKVQPPPVPSSRQRPVELNQKKIEKLIEESEQIKERLIVEEDVQEQSPATSVPVEPPIVPVLTENVESIPKVAEVAGVDEEWQTISQQWQPEHWEFLRLLCQEQPVQLTVEERKNHRPVSRLIDEINTPVDEQLGDLLIDPGTQMLSPHLRATAKKLVDSYYTSIKR